MRKYLLIDTSILMHYRRLDQIDWSTEVSASEVVLLIAPVILRELDNNKSIHRGKHLRGRAGERVKWLNSLVAEGFEVELPLGVTLRFLTAEPAIDFAEHGLNKAVQDDWLIAHAIEWSNAYPDDHVAVLTADTGQRMKAVGHGLVVVFWEDNEYRIPEKEDPDRKRIKELERENLELKTRVPILSLQFDNGQEYKNFVLQEWTEWEIRRRINDLRGKCAAGGSRPDLGPGFLLRRKSYEELLWDYFDEYEKYLRLESLLRGNAVRFDLAIANDGKRVAEDIDVELTIPAGFSVLLEDDLPVSPQPPKPPSPNDLVVAGMPIGLRDFRPGSTNASGPDLDGGRGIVTYHAKTVKNSQRVTLEPFFLAFRQVPRASFSVSYRLLAADVEPVDGKLSAIVAESPAKGSGSS